MFVTSAVRSRYVVYGIFSTTVVVSSIPFLPPNCENLVQDNYHSINAEREGKQRQQTNKHTIVF